MEEHLCHEESKEAVDDGVEAKEEETVEKGELVIFQGRREVNIFKEQLIDIHTFHWGEVDVLPVQANPLLLIPECEGDDDGNGNVGDADEGHHCDLPQGKVGWCHAVSL